MSWTDYKKYCEKLKQGNSVDFDDLLVLTLELFNNHPDVLDYYQYIYQFLILQIYCPIKIYQI